MTSTLPNFNETERRKLAEAALRSITESTSRVTGGDFYRVLVRDLASALDVTYVIAGRLTSLNGEESIETLAVWAGSDYAPNLTYSLTNTPCRNVTSQDMCFHPCGIQTDYPEDVLLQEMKAESYIGMPMVDTQGKTLGILVGLDVRPMDDNKRLLALSLLSIFAARCAAELQHQDREAELERRVQERTEQLRQTQRQLVEREKLAALGGLVAGIAHEINTPVGIAVTAASGIEDFSREMVEKIQGVKVSRTELLQLAEELHRASALVSCNLQRAAHLLSSFKTLAVDQGTETIMALDLEHYLQTIIETHAPALRRAHIRTELTCDGEMKVKLAGGMLSQIVSNLLMNSLKHGFEGREVTPTEGNTITIHLQRSGDVIEMNYRDNGRGISPEAEPRLFEPFYTTKRGQGGSGLGLSIVFSLLQRIGGNICLLRRSETEPGLAFLIRLPTEQQTVHPPPAPETSP